MEGERVPTMRLLLIDDDVELTSLMQEFLGQNEMEVEAVADGTQGLARALNGGYDLVILDGMLPGLDGFEVLRQLRRRSNVPVIMLTAKVAPQDRINGLDMGADDYLTKPFGPEELVARIRAVLRRSGTGGLAPKQDMVEVGGLRVDPAAREAYLSTGACGLTNIQFEVLEYLMRHAGRAVSRDELTAVLHQRDATPFERWLDVHISQLRKKIEADGATRIHTIRGVGYMFSTSQMEAQA
jgi:two-component system, OmpR family, response regulator CpxR